MSITHKQQILSKDLTDMHCDRIYHLFLKVINICQERYVQQWPSIFTKLSVIDCCHSIWGNPLICTLEYYAQNMCINFYRKCDYLDVKKLYKEEILTLCSEKYLSNKELSNISKELRNISIMRAQQFVGELSII